jgi:hypothetical protein
MADRKKSQARRWQAILIRKRGQILGTIKASDEQAASKQPSSAAFLSEENWDNFAA